MPLYEGCDLTKKESELLIMSFLIRHNLSDVGLADLISLINCHLPRAQYGSVYTFLKQYDAPQNVIVHFYCSYCQTLTMDGDDSGTAICGACCREYEKTVLKREGNYFLQIPLTEQLKAMVNSDLYAKFRKESELDSDVVTGKTYCSLREANVFAEHDITIQFNVDGVQLFNSSTTSMWPIQVAINELSYTDRRDNILLCGVWYGKSKPKMETFLKFFVDELIDLHQVGITRIDPEGREISIKVHAIVCSVDSVARPLLQNIHQYNGEFGCPFCLNKGENVPLGRGFARVYPGDVGPNRTLAQHEIDCQEAVNTKSVINGVKGPSILMLLPVFNIISSFVPDYMHCVLLGVTKTITNAWFDPSNNEKAWYIGTQVQEIDIKLGNMKPPSEITRTPKSVKERQHWKATEWKNYLLYYSLLCLMNNMPLKYIKHWFLLVYSMQIFLQDKILPEQFKKAKAALEKFVFQITDLYGIQFFKFNVHLLLHIPLFVKYYGALWATSAFPYEHYNGILAKLIKSSQAPAEQICKSYLRLINIRKESSLVFSRDNCSNSGQILYQKMLGSFRSKFCTQLGCFLRLFGAPVQITLTLVQQTCIEQLFQSPINNFAQKYDRFIYQNVLYHSTDYERLRKRRNGTVQLKDGTFVEITGIFIVQIVATNEMQYVILGNMLRPTDDIPICNDNELHISSNEFFHILTKSDDLIAIFPNMIHSKCVHMDYDCQKIICVPLVNKVERD